MPGLRKTLNLVGEYILFNVRQAGYRFRNVIQNLTVSVAMKISEVWYSSREKEKLLPQNSLENLFHHLLSISLLWVFLRNECLLKLYFRKSWGTENNPISPKSQANKLQKRLKEDLSGRTYLRKWNCIKQINWMRDLVNYSPQTYHAISVAMSLAPPCQCPKLRTGIQKRFNPRAR